MSTAPTDSVLRRHHEQMHRAVRMAPTDSVLRRHHEQMRQAARSGIGSDHAHRPAEPAAPPGEPPPASRPAPAPESVTSRPAPAPAPEPTTTSRGGGFFGWLKRLFGG